MDADCKDAPRGTSAQSLETPSSGCHNSTSKHPSWWSWSRGMPCTCTSPRHRGREAASPPIRSEHTSPDHGGQITHGSLETRRIKFFTTRIRPLLKDPGSAGWYFHRLQPKSDWQDPPPPGGMGCQVSPRPGKCSSTSRRCGNEIFNVLVTHFFRLILHRKKSQIFLVFASSLKKNFLCHFYFHCFSWG